MKHKLLIVLVNLAVLSAVGWRYCVGQQDHDQVPAQLHHYLEGDRLGQIPQDGFVTKEETALAISKAVLTEQTWMKKYATGT
ncbi:MAG: hypothetical protein GC165_14600 [Armatimonadetes bacterium]|nr:hypothetical protein [Armatimonadota bacterium]MBS1725698.1 hypothetical protein [Armatimonadota bacterium]